MSLVIDSAVAYYTKDGIRVMLFSGDQFYESESVGINDNLIDFKVKSIKELDETLKPPIDTAYNDINDPELDLCLQNVSYILLEIMI